MKNIAVFASGSGSNAENIIKYFQKSPFGEVKLVLSNKKDAFVHKRANVLGIESVDFARDEFYNSDSIINILGNYSVDYVVLAGFLWLIPENLLNKYEGRIINIHPALLPKYGGKGMYGMNVHKAVIEAGEKESGITIHHVNKRYDEGDIIFQAKCPVYKEDSPESLVERIHSLEHKYFPEVIEKEIQKLKKA